MNDFGQILRCCFIANEVSNILVFFSNYSFDRNSTQTRARSNLVG